MQKRREPRVFTIKSPKSATNSSAYGRQFFIHIMNYALNDHISVEVGIDLRRQSIDRALARSSTQSSTTNPKQVPVPFLKKASHQSSVFDALKVVDREVERVVCLKDDTPAKIVLWVYGPWCPELATSLSLARLRLFDPTNLGVDPNETQLSPRTVGAQRTRAPPKGIRCLDHPGPHGTLDIRGAEEQFHRLQVQMSPVNSSTSSVLETCVFFLPPNIAEWLRVTWWNRWGAASDGFQCDWDALMAALLLLPLSLEENGASQKAKTRRSRTASRSSFSIALPSDGERSSWDQMWSREGIANRLGFLKSSAWTQITEMSFLDAAEPDAARKSSGLQVVEPNFNTILRKTRNFVASEDGKQMVQRLRQNKDNTRTAIGRLLIALHLLREEWKLDVLSGSSKHEICPVLAQFGRWLGWHAWDWKEGKYFRAEIADADQLSFEDSTISACSIAQPGHFSETPSLLAWLEKAISTNWTAAFPDFSAVFTVNPASAGYSPRHVEAFVASITPRTAAVSAYIRRMQDANNRTSKLVESIHDIGITKELLETFPESVSALLQEPIIRCRINPPTTWSGEVLELVSREDLNLEYNELSHPDTPAGPLVSPVTISTGYLID